LSCCMSTSQPTTLIFLLALASTTAASGADLSRRSLLEVGYGQMYNLEFDAAHQSFRDWEQKRPDDPMGPISDAAAYLFSEFDRLHILQSEFFVHDDNFRGGAALKPNPQVKVRFEEALETGRRLAESALARNPQDSNARLALVIRLGLHSDYLALIEKRYLPSLAEMKLGRSLAEQLTATDPECFDAYLAIGAENYLLSLKPAPVRWLLRVGGARTDRDEGIRNLQITAEKGRLLPPFARLLLAVAALRENQPDKARELLGGLAREFPRNQLYALELARLR
jgi:hypothetical protein